MGHPFVGQEVDGYRILEVLGQGGMGVVYKAKNMSLDRIEALKVIAPSLVQDAQFLHRFKREAQALARIHHPNIVTVYTLRHAEIGHYLTMEYVEGQTLADRLVEGRGMSWSAAMPIIKQLLAAFDYAHRRGIIHRDIKPRNIMLTPDQVVKVMDFGLAKFYQQHDVTRTQGVSGTLCYMSPEQIKGHARLDQRSDIFSIGMTLYEVLSGRLPFDKNDSQFSIQRSIVEEEFPAPHRLKEDIPARLSAIVMRAVHKEPAQRYQHAREMLSAIEAFEAEMRRTEVGASDATRVEGVSESTRPSRTAGRWKRWAVGAALAGSIVWAVWAVHPAFYAYVVGGEAERLSPAEEVTGASEGWGEVPSGGAMPQEATAQQESSTSPEQDSPGLQEAETTAGAASESGQTRSDPSDSPPGDGLEPSTGAEEASTGEESDPVESADSGLQQATGQDGDSGQGNEPAPEEQPGAEGAKASTPGGEPIGEEGQTEVSPKADRSGNAVPPENEAQPAEPEVRPLDRVRGEAVALQGKLRQAIMERQWAGVPAPLADYYGAMLDDIYSKFSVINVESTAGELQTDDATATLPITVYISYRQRGREGIKAFPIPATWVWTTGEEGLVLSHVQAP